MVDYAELREKLIRRRERLSRLKAPPITKRMMHKGISTRPMRKMIEGHRREILRQKQSYGRQITAIEEYIERKRERENMEMEDMEEMEMIAEPKISLFPLPKLKKVKKIGRINWLK